MLGSEVPPCRTTTFGGGQGLDVPEVVPVAVEGVAVDVCAEAVWVVPAAVLQPGGSAFFLCVRRLAVEGGVLVAEAFGVVVAEDGAGDGAAEF